MYTTFIEILGNKHRIGLIIDNKNNFINYALVTNGKNYYIGDADLTDEQIMKESYEFPSVEAARYAIEYMIARS